MFVYLTYCITNGKAYIGKYEGSENDNYLGSGKLLVRAINKYGKDNFKRIILERFNDRDSCAEGEKKWIHLFNAVESKTFYNIARGGDGGDTFSGLSLEDRVQLSVKLKNRKKRNSPEGFVAYIDLLHKKTGSCTIDEYTKDSFKVGIKTKVLYITPMGTFSSVKIANKVIGLDMKSLQKRCLQNENIITTKNTSGSEHRLKEHDLKFLGKSFKEAGYSVQSLNEVLEWNLDKIKNLKIIKNE
jgi:hypothetical protein